MLKKIFTVIVILLFLGVEITPLINANLNADEFVEFTCEIFGFDDVRPSSVKVSQSQADDIDRLFIELRTQLEKSASTEETYEIYDNAIEILSDYGLLDVINVYQMKRGIKTQFLINKFFQDKFGSNQIIEDDVYENSFCYITSKIYQGIASTGILIPFLWLIFLLLHNVLSEKLYNLLMISTISGLFGLFKKMHFLDIFYFGLDYWIPYTAQGWISTDGLNGVWEVNGSFIGAIPMWPVFMPYYGHPGVLNFCGFGIFNKDTECYYLFGVASKVKITTVDI